MRARASARRTASPTAVARAGCRRSGGSAAPRGWTAPTRPTRCGRAHRRGGGGGWTGRRGCRLTGAAPARGRRGHVWREEMAWPPRAARDRGRRRRRGDDDDDDRGGVRHGKLGGGQLRRHQQRRRGRRKLGDSVSCMIGDDRSEVRGALGSNAILHSRALRPHNEVVAPRRNTQNMSSQARDDGHRLPLELAVEERSHCGGRRWALRRHLRGNGDGRGRSAHADDHGGSADLPWAASVEPRPRRTRLHLAESVASALSSSFLVLLEVDRDEVRGSSSSSGGLALMLRWSAPGGASKRVTPPGAPADAARQGGRPAPAGRQRHLCLPLEGRAGAAYRAAREAQVLLTVQRVVDEDHRESAGLIEDPAASASGMGGGAATHPRARPTLAWHPAQRRA